MSILTPSSASDAAASLALSDRPSDPHTILLVEDDPMHATLVQRFFERAGFNVVITPSGSDTVDLIRSEAPAVVLLDLTLPDVDGLDVAREIRRVSDVPIIFLTARASEMDKITGLELGGDDYITKPFSLRELHARINAVARRVSVSPPAPPALEVGPYRLDWSRREVIDDAGSEIILTHKEIELFWFLTTHPGVALTRETLFDKVWGSAAIASSRTLDVHIANLRRKMPELEITTVRGTGYRLDTTVVDPSVSE